jgi:hypothetical protein
MLTGANTMRRDRRDGRSASLGGGRRQASLRRWVEALELCHRAVHHALESGEAVGRDLCALQTSERRSGLEPRSGEPAQEDAEKDNEENRELYHASLR